MRPTATGLCANHEPSIAGEQRSYRREAGRLAMAKRTLDAKKAEAITRLGVETLPDLTDIKSVQQYIVGVAMRVESKQLTPAQGNTLATLVKLSKDLIQTETHIRLLEALEEEKEKKHGR
jgi:hypothetical protein